MKGRVGTILPALLVFNGYPLSRILSMSTVVGCTS